MLTSHYEITTAYFGDRSVAKLTAKKVKLTGTIPGRLNQAGGDFHGKLRGKARTFTFDEIAGTLGWKGFEHLAVA